MTKREVEYESILDMSKLFYIYNIIKKNTLHREKLVKYEEFLVSNFINILHVLKNKSYRHGKYNIFIISEPKHRIIMSECLDDKIVNHMVSFFFLSPILEKKFIEANVATRKNKGTSAGIKYIKRYINSLKTKYEKIYVLKCDISKYFYSIDHDILIEKLEKVYGEGAVLNILKEIIFSTDKEYINENINKQVVRLKEINKNKDIPFREKRIIDENLSRLPRYVKGKGLPIGNMTSQILAIFYLNDLDHYIKEDLHIKCYVRYMDDFILLHPDKEYLKYCLKMIQSKVENVKLKLNKKTQILEIHNGINFLGYRFVLKEKRLYVLINSKTKRRIKKKLKNVPKNERYEYLYHRYKGHLGYAKNRGFYFQYKR